MNSTNILHNFSGSVKEESMENLSLYQITNAFPALMESEEITEENKKQNEEKKEEQKENTTVEEKDDLPF